MIALATSQEEIYTRVLLHCMHICEMALNPYLIRCLIHDTDMLFLLLKNAKDSSLAESSCLTLALATHTKKIKSFDGKRGGSHEMLISDTCHNYQF